MRPKYAFTTVECTLFPETILPQTFYCRHSPARQAKTSICEFWRCFRYRKTQFLVAYNALLSFIAFSICCMRRTSRRTGALHDDALWGKQIDDTLVESADEQMSPLAVDYITKLSFSSLLTMQYSVRTHANRRPILTVPCRPYVVSRPSWNTDYHFASASKLEDCGKSLADRGNGRG